MSDLSMLINGLKVSAEGGTTFERRNPLDGSVATRAPAASPPPALARPHRAGRPPAGPVLPARRPSRRGGPPWGVRGPSPASRAPILGASPGEASSGFSGPAPLNMARAPATICCSPPLIVPAS